MPLIVNNSETPREKPMLGLHDAIFCFTEDLGTHITKTQWGDKAQRKLVIMWEIDENMKGTYDEKYAGKPFIVSKQYTFTLFEKGNLSKDLESFASRKITDEVRKTGFDIETLVGKKCQVNLIESDDGKYINVGSVLPASKDNKLVRVCTVCPEWVAKKRASSLEVIHAPQSGADPSEPPPSDNYPGADDSNLPF